MIGISERNNRHLFEESNSGFRRRKLRTEDLAEINPEVMEIEFEIRENATAVTDERVRLLKETGRKHSLISDGDPVRR